jgi:hypothetical protein
MRRTSIAHFPRLSSLSFLFFLSLEIPHLHSTFSSRPRCAAATCPSGRRRAYPSPPPVGEAPPRVSSTSSPSPWRILAPAPNPRLGFGSGCRRWCPTPAPPAARAAPRRLPESQFRAQLHYPDADVHLPVPRVDLASSSAWPAACDYSVAYLSVSYFSSSLSLCNVSCDLVIGQWWFCPGSRHGSVMMCVNRVVLLIS